MAGAGMLGGRVATGRLRGVPRDPAEQKHKGQQEQGHGNRDGRLGLLSQHDLREVLKVVH